MQFIAGRIITEKPEELPGLFLFRQLGGSLVYRASSMPLCYGYSSSIMPSTFSMEVTPSRTRFIAECFRVFIPF